MRQVAVTGHSPTEYVDEPLAKNMYCLIMSKRIGLDWCKIIEIWLEDKVKQKMVIPQGGINLKKM